MRRQRLCNRLRQAALREIGLLRPREAFVSATDKSGEQPPLFDCCCCNGNVKCFDRRSAASGRSSIRASFREIFSKALPHLHPNGLVQQTVQIVARSSHDLTLFVKAGALDARLIEAPRCHPPSADDLIRSGVRYPTGLQVGSRWLEIIGGDQAEIVEGRIAAAALVDQCIAQPERRALQWSTVWRPLKVEVVFVLVVIRGAHAVADHC